MDIMKATKKAGVIVLILILCFNLAACEMNFGNNSIPKATSEDWGLYIKEENGMNTIVDDAGKLSFDYSFDKRGNVIDANKTIIIGKENLSEFISVSNINIQTEDISNIILDKELYNKNDGNPTSSIDTDEKIIKQDIRIEFSVEPANATNRETVIETSDQNIAKLTEANDKGKLHVKTDKDGKGAFTVSFLNEGAVSVIIGSADGECEKNYPISVKVNEKAINEDEYNQANTKEDQNQMTDPVSTDVEERHPSQTSVITAGTDKVTETESNEIRTNQVMSSTETVVLSDAIPTTDNTPGWVNGSKVNLREEPNSTSKVLGTYASGKDLIILGQASGWSKVRLDNMTGYLKSVYITTTDPNKPKTTSTQTGTSGNVTYGQQTSTSGNRTGTSSYYSSNSSGTYSSSTGSNGTGSTQVNAPIASNDGYDHGYAFSSEASPTGNREHAHDFKVESSVAPSGSDSGYTLYKCSCGESYKGPYSPEAKPVETSHVHEYFTSVHQPLCDDFGYTEHRCSCGDSYLDDFVQPAGHKFTSETLGDGSLKYTCENCLYSYTDAIDNSNRESDDSPVINAEVYD